MDPVLVDVTGYTATFFGTMVMLPQAVKTWRTRKVDDLSPVMLFFYFMNCLLWLVYAYFIDALPLLLTNALALMISITQIGLYISIKRERR